MKVKQLTKSKTIDFNVLVPVVSGILYSFGVPVPPEAIAGILALGNIILRLVTKKPLSEK